ncbi:unnamed protein product, partial [marine sediment metagenome]
EGGESFLLFINSYKDGVDTIDWIREQSWSNGKIASAGVSALCLNQYYYAGMGPEGLLAQQLWFGTPEMFDHAIFQGSYHKSSVETWVSGTSPTNWEYQIDTLFSKTIKKISRIYWMILGIFSIRLLLYFSRILVKDREEIFNP